MHNPILLCLTTDNWIGIGQGIATLLVGIATIMTYLKITKISADATEKASQISAAATKAASDLAEQTLLFNKLNQDLDRIVEYTIKYPYFEDEEYTQMKYRQEITSNTEVEKERALRYELFAIMNFNFFEDLYRFCKGDNEKMSNIANYQELVESHSTYWKYRIIEKKEGGYTLITPLVNKILKLNTSSS